MSGVDAATGIVAPDGSPARAAVEEAPTSKDPCPGREGVGCGSDKTKRGKSGGFGAPHVICTECGHEWLEEKFNV